MAEQSNPCRFADNDADRNFPPNDEVALCYALHDLLCASAGIAHTGDKAAFAISLDRIEALTGNWFKTFPETAEEQLEYQARNSESLTPRVEARRRRQRRPLGFSPVVHEIGADDLEPMRPEPEPIDSQETAFLELAARLEPPANPEARVAWERTNLSQADAEAIFQHTRDGMSVKPDEVLTPTREGMTIAPVSVAGEPLATRTDLFIFARRIKGSRTYYLCVIARGPQKCVPAVLDASAVHATPLEEEKPTTMIFPS